MKKIRDEFTPATEGLDHINCSTESNTLLGIMLSPFYKAPFMHPKYGVFTTLEGAWQYIKFHKYEAIHPEIGQFKVMSKGGCRVLRSKLDALLGEVDYPDNFQIEFSECVASKIYSNIEIARELRDSTLPIMHYRVEPDYNIIHYPHTWYTQLITDIRKHLQMHK